MHVGIVGYGKMGTGIFRLLAAKDLAVTVYVRTEEKRAEHERRFFKSLERAVKRGRTSREDYDLKRRNIRFTSRYEDFAIADLVVETAVEDFDEKRKMLRQLEHVVSDSAMLATNTSSISIEELAKGMTNPQRFCGLHFFYPVVLIDLIEIIRTKNTPRRLTDSLQAFCENIGRKWIRVYDAPGSVVNYILSHYYAESLHVLEEGLLPPSRIDELARRFFYVGPCESMDVIGIDFLVNALERLTAAAPTAMPRPEILNRSGNGSSEVESAGDSERKSEGQPGAESLMESGKESGGRLVTTAADPDDRPVPGLLYRLLDDGRLGKKMGRGIYLYERERPVDDEPGAYRGPGSSVQGSLPMGDDQLEELVADRLLYAVFAGALETLSKGLADQSDIDVGVAEVLQMEQGPYSTMKALGLGKVKDRFGSLANRLGRRFRKSELVDLVEG